MNNIIVALVAFGKDSTNRLSSMLTKLKVNHQIVYLNEIPLFKYTHIILSGGPKHVYEIDHYHMPQWVLDSNAPVLGVCYGMQLIAKTFGGIVAPMRNVEKGAVEVTEIINGHQVIGSRWMNRLDTVVVLTPNFTTTGVTYLNHIAAFTDYDKWWAVQYHPESKHHGDPNVLKRFLRQNRRNFTQKLYK